MTIVAAAARLAANVATTPTLDLTTFKTRICAFRPEIPRFRIILIAIQSNRRGASTAGSCLPLDFFLSQILARIRNYVVIRRPWNVAKLRQSTLLLKNVRSPAVGPFAGGAARPAQLRRAQPTRCVAHRTTSWPRSAPPVPPARLSCWSTTSAILADNPLGDPHVRKLAVWLPAEYDDGASVRRGRRFPVLYDMVGFTGSGLAHVGWKPFGDNVPERARASFTTKHGADDHRVPRLLHGARRQPVRQFVGDRRATPTTSPAKSSRSSTASSARSRRASIAAASASRPAATARSSTA